MDEITAPPVVPGFTEPVPDFNTQSDDVFSDNAQRMVNELPPFHNGMTDLADWMHAAGQYVYTLSQEVQQGAISAEEFATLARGFANFKGLWSALSGPEVIGVTVEHNNKIWVSRHAMSAIQNEEPGVSGVWRDTSVDGGVLVVTGPNDVRPDRVTNTAWNFYSAVGKWNATDSRTDPDINVDTLIAGTKYILNRSVNQGLFPTGPGGGWCVETFVVHGSHRYQIAHAMQTDAVPQIFYRYTVASGGSFAGVEWVPLHGSGGSSGPTTSEPVVTLPVPVRSAEYLVGGNVYGVDIPLDFSAANIFRGFTTAVQAQLPPGAEVPLGLTGSNGFRHNFVLQNLPEDDTTTMIKYLRYSGFLRSGPGGGILTFTVPAGWTLTWKAGQNGTAVAPTLSALNGSPTAASEELQIEVNGSNKRVTITKSGWL